MTVVTAAHCIEKRDPWGVFLDMRPLLSTLRIGCTTISDPAGTRWCQERRITKVDIHPEWDGNVGAQAKDVAVLTLDQPVKLHPVSLAGSASPNDMAEVMGYGQTGDGTYMDMLRYTTQYIESVEGSSLITKGDVSGPCYGDSGSPLVTAQGLVGIVSYGTGACDSVNDVDGYFYIPSERAWIDLMKTYAPPAGDGSGSSPPAEPPTEPPRPSPAVDLKDGTYSLQVVSYGPCRGKFLSATIRNDCSDRMLRLYSASTVKDRTSSSTSKKPSKSKSPSKGKNKDKKKKKGKGGKKGKEKNGKSTRGRRALLAAKHKYKPAAMWKLVTKPSDGTAYIESIARETCVAPFIQMTSTGSALLGAINQGWILEKHGSKYVKLLNSDTYTYLSSYTSRCSLQSAQGGSRRGTVLKFRMIGS